MISKSKPPREGGGGLEEPTQHIFQLLCMKFTQIQFSTEVMELFALLCRRLTTLLLGFKTHVLAVIAGEFMPDEVH